MKAVKTASKRKKKPSLGLIGLAAAAVALVGTVALLNRGGVGDPAHPSPGAGSVVPASAPFQRAADSKGVRVLGKLGQALEATSIYAGQSLKARVYYELKAFEYLVVRDSSQPEWRQVLLRNGKLGYVQSAKVAALPYEVTEDPAAPRAAKSGPGARAGVAKSSLRYVGTPYRRGGNDLERGVDGSGFVQRLFGEIGVQLPRKTAAQAAYGKPVARLEDLQAGDRLYFWDEKGGRVGHTGIYLGNGYFSHASPAKGQVATDYLGEDQWLQTLVAARR